MNKIDKVTNRSRKAVNLSVDAELVEAAKSMDMNLSQIFESSLRQAVSEEQKRRWVEENREAIDEYNERIDREGTLGMKVWAAKHGPV
ncbi:MAG: type II toxin-antitoxin system CcdA family antitoxin [Sphingomonadales bacterium]